MALAVPAEDHEGTTAASEEQQQLRPVASEHLRDKLKERLRRSDGEKDSNCFIRPGQEGDGYESPTHEHVVSEDEEMNTDVVVESDLILCGKLSQRKAAVEQLMRAGASLQPASPSQKMAKSADAAAGTAASELSPQFRSASPRHLDSSAHPKECNTDGDALTCDVACEGGDSDAVARAAAAVTSPAAMTHGSFDLRTPHSTRGGRTPGSGNSGSQRSRVVNVLSPNDLDADDAEGLQYEWQFEILNNMPREKAIALVDHLKQSERERAQATIATAQLRKEVQELQQQLQATVAQKHVGIADSADSAEEANCDQGSSRPSRPAKEIRPRRRGCCCWGVLRLLLRLAAVVLVAAAAAAMALHCSGVSPGSRLMDYFERHRPSSTNNARLDALAAAAAAAVDNTLAGLLPRGILNSCPGSPAPGANAEVQLLHAQLEEFRRNSSACTAKLGAGRVAIATKDPMSSHGNKRQEDVVREATVREMALRETTLQEYDPESINRITEEHKVMKEQLNMLHMLQNDIDDALHAGRSTVCWPIN